MVYSYGIDDDHDDENLDYDVYEDGLELNCQLVDASSEISSNLCKLFLKGGFISKTLFTRIF